MRDKNALLGANGQKSVNKIPYWLGKEVIVGKLARVIISIGTRPFRWFLKKSHEGFC